MIELCNAKKTYRRGPQESLALRGVSLRIASGEFLLIRGKSGSGKTTLLNLIGCLDVPTSGAVKIKGIDTRSIEEKRLAELRNATIGYVFQTLHLRRRQTAIENVMMPLVVRGERISAARERAMRVLSQVGLEREAMKHADELSGGQAQRVAIARAIVTEPEVVLADEPTGNLDRKTGEEILQELISLRLHQERTLIIVTHDEFPLRFADAVVTLDDGSIVENIKRGGKENAAT